MPLGRRAKAPNDKLVAKVVDLVSYHTDTRERLIQGAYRGEKYGAAYENGLRNPLAVYDSLLDRVEKAEGIYKKIGDAIKAGKYDEATLSIEGRINEGVEMGILTADEGEFMIAFEKDVLEMVHVDHFPLEHFGTVAENHDKQKAY